MGTKFVILSAPRTGSTLLVKTLNSMSGICCHGELLQQQVRGYEDGFDLLEATKEERVARAQRLVENRGENPVGFIQGALTREGFICGVKVQYQDFLAERWTDVADYLLQAPDLKFIHLQRRNSLKRYISDEISRAGGPNHSGPGGRGDVRKTVHIDPEAFTQRTAELEQQAQDVLARLSPRELYSVTYEDLAADLPGTVAGLCAYIGVQARADNVEPALQKVGRDDLRDSVTNYDELAASALTRDWLG